MKIRSFCKYILLIATLLSCSGNGLHPREDQDSNPLKDFDRLLKGELSIVCADGLSCPESIYYIALLEPKDPQKIRSCPGFAISPSRLVLSSQCLPKEYQVNNYQCKDKIFIFGKENEKSQYFSCQKVFKTEFDQSASFPQLTLKDYVLLDINQEGNQKLKPIELFGFSQPKGEKLDLWQFSDLKNNKTVLSKKVCSLFIDTYDNPLSVEGESMTQTLSECDLGASSIGALAMDPIKKVGLGYVTSDGECNILNSESKICDEKLFMKNKPQHYYLYTFDCELSVSNLVRDKEMTKCLSYREQDGTLFNRRKKYQKKVLKEELQQYYIQLEESSPLIKWCLSFSKSASFDSLEDSSECIEASSIAEFKLREQTHRDFAWPLRYRAACFRSKDQWLQNFCTKKCDTDKPKLRKKYQIDLKMITEEITMGFDSHYYPLVNIPETQLVSISFNPAEVYEKGFGELKVKALDGEEQTISEIPFCLP